MRANYTNDLVVKDGFVVDARAHGADLTHTTIQAAITAISTDKRTLLIGPGVWAVTANLSIPSNVCLKVMEGGVLTVATGITLTVLGPVEIGMYQAFSLVGTGKIDMAGATVTEVYPQWWGAIVDDGVSDVAAIQAAVSSGAKIVRFPVGTYTIDSAITIIENQKLVGSSNGNVVTNGSLLQGTHAGTILTHNAMQDYEIAYLSFSGAGCSAIKTTDTTTYMAASEIHHCNFNANLTECIYSTLVICRIHHNWFGYYGTPGAAHRHIYSPGVFGAASTNLNFVHHNRFFNAIGTQSIYFHAGQILHLHANEWSTCSALPIKLAGMEAVKITASYFEALTSTYLVELADDDSNVYACGAVVFENNYFGVVATQTHIVNITSDVNANSTHVKFYNNMGNISGGQYMTTAAALASYTTGDDGRIIKWEGNFIRNYSRGDDSTPDKKLNGFLAVLDTAVANQTGDGTAYVVKFETLDQGNRGAAYAVGTGIFTATSEGFFTFDIAVALAQLGAGHTTGLIELVTTDRSFQETINPYAISAGGIATLKLSVSTHMHASDTAFVRVTVTGSTKTVDIHSLTGSGKISYFSGVRMYGA
jgi:hypothetical protein